MEDDFVEIAPDVARAIVSSVTIGTIALRGGTERVSLSFEEAVFAKLEGWPRVRADWSPTRFEIRLRATSDGPFEAYRPKKGSRIVLRLPMQAGLQVRAKLKEPCPYRWEGTTLFLIVPPVFRRLPSTPGVGAQAKAAIDAARKQVPAPDFSGPGKRR